MPVMSECGKCLSKPTAYGGKMWTRLSNRTTCTLCSGARKNSYLYSNNRKQLISPSGLRERYIQISLVVYHNMAEFATTSPWTGIVIGQAVNRYSRTCKTPEATCYRGPIEQIFWSNLLAASLETFAKDIRQKIFSQCESFLRWRVKNIGSTYNKVGFGKKTIFMEMRKCQ